MSRVTNVLKNARVGLIFYVLVLATHFFSRKIFLEFLGDEFVGLVYTVQSIIGFLNLAELGIGTAVGFALYKPIIDRNRDKINLIISLVAFLYKNIGILILGLSIIISFFFPIIFSDIQFDLIIVYFIFFSFIITSLLGYFYNYHIILLEADQKAYVVTRYFQTGNILRLITQSTIALYLESYILWILMEIIFGVAYSVLLRFKIKSTYPWLLLNLKFNKSDLKKFKELIKKIKQTFIHKISAFVLGGTDQILIFSLVSLKSVAFFGNYQLIFGQISNLLNSLFKGTAAGIGNLVAEGNINNIQKVFWEMKGVRYFIGGFISMIIYFQIDSFISVWIGEEYVLDPLIVLAMSILFLLSQIRVPVENFKNAYGLFEDVWAPVAEMLLNLVISFVFGYYYGIVGILLGSLISVFVIVILWKPYYLYRRAFKLSVWKYWNVHLKYIFSVGISFLICWNIILKIDYLQYCDGYLKWILNSIIVSGIVFFIYTPILFTWNKGFRDIVNRMKVRFIK